MEIGELCILTYKYKIVHSQIKNEHENMFKLYYDNKNLRQCNNKNYL